MLLCLSLDAQRSELLLITVSVMPHCHSLPLEKETGGEVAKLKLLLSEKEYDMIFFFKECWGGCVVEVQ